VASLSVALAANIVISPIANDKAVNHKYVAYRLFAGTVAEDNKTLSNVAFSEGVVGANLVAALQADNTLKTKNKIAALTSTSTAKDVAEALADITTKSSDADALAAVLDGFFVKTVEDYTKHEASSVSAATDSYSIDIGSDYGYYFVRDEQTAYKDADGAATTYTGTTKYVLQVVGTLTIKPKTTVPEITKKLKNHDELAAAYRDANNVGIGDTIDFKITSSVPDMTDFNHYWFVVSDTLSKGLKYNGDLAITVGTNDTVTVVTSEADNTGKTALLTKTGSESTATGTNLRIAFHDFYNNFKNVVAGTPITITYTAELTSDALIGKEGNANEVELIYSNNPNEDGDGDDVDEDDVYGKTPKDITITYSTNLKIVKVDEKSDPLPGVQFTISGYGENDKATYAEEYQKADNGNYYLLADGTYTETAPTTLTAGKYNQTVGEGKKDVTTYQMYKLVVTKDSTAMTVTYPAKTGTTAASTGELDIGALIANGSLPAGTYVIHEAQTVDGYNILDHDIIVKVTAKISDTADTAATISEVGTDVTWEVVGEGATVDPNTGLITIRIENKKGSQLPETGGMGTTILYVAGSILVLAAVILLVTKRRMGSND